MNYFGTDLLFVGLKNLKLRTREFEISSNATCITNIEGSQQNGVLDLLDPSRPNFCYAIAGEYLKDFGNLIQLQFNLWIAVIAIHLNFGRYVL